MQLYMPLIVHDVCGSSPLPDFFSTFCTLCTDLVAEKQIIMVFTRYMIYNLVAHKQYISGSPVFFLGLRTRTGNPNFQVRRLLAGFHLKFSCAAPVNRTRGSAYESVGMADSVPHLTSKKQIEAEPR